MKKLVLLLGAVTLAFMACNDKDDDITPDDNKLTRTQQDSIAENKTINKTIYDIMDIYYLWADQLPIYEKGDGRYPSDFFESLLYKIKDHWSFISDDAQALNAELTGVPLSMGYSPQFWRFSEGDNVFCLVEYVYPESPAAKAGLKRGDIILTINETPLDIHNYYDLYCETEATIGLGKLDVESSTIDIYGEPIKMTAEVLSADPSIYDTIFYVNGKPIGYYVYVQYTSGPNGKFVSTMDNIFDKFKAAGVKDLILDLRHNGGGDGEMAKHLASNIAPSSVIRDKSILITNIYNDILTEAYKEQEKDDESVFVERFKDYGHNADMSNVYVLTTNSTASASELTIIGLKPYMNVILIGTNTYGKYTGMYTFDKSLGGDFRKLKNWAMMPITLKYANAAGFTDFENGIAPDYTVDDNLIDRYQFGDVNDPFISTALDLAGGLPMTAKAARIDLPFKYVGRDRDIYKNNLIINKALPNLQ